MFARFIYFVAIGWWTGLLASVVAYVLCLSIIGIPLGVMIFNRLPTIIFQKDTGRIYDEGFDHCQVIRRLPFLLRAFWFVVIGWHLGLLALVAGYTFTLTIIGVPLGIFLINRVPLLMTLNREYA